MLILFLIIVIVFFVVLLYSKEQRKKNDTDNKSFTHKITIELDEKTIHKTNEEATAYRKRMERLCKKDSNKTRKRHVWAVLRFIKSIESIMHSENFYDLDKSIGDFQDSKARLFEEHYSPTNEEIDTAIRFCTIGYTLGRCSHQLTLNEKYDIYHWETYFFNNLFIINNVVDSFKTYWDDVLADYKRPSARLNRVNYLINHLNEMKEKETMQLLPNFEEKINELILYYQSLL